MSKVVMTLLLVLPVFAQNQNEIKTDLNNLRDEVESNTDHFCEFVTS